MYLSNYYTYLDYLQRRIYASYDPFSLIIILNSEDIEYFDNTISEKIPATTIERFSGIIVIREWFLLTFWLKIIYIHFRIFFSVKMIIEIFYIMNYFD